jgi:hypothetical protein
MEIEPIDRTNNELTPLLLNAKPQKCSPQATMIPDRARSLSSYLEVLPNDLRYHVSCYLKPDTTAHTALLENATLKKHQAEDLYRKFNAYNQIRLLPKLMKTQHNLTLLARAHEHYQEKIHQIASHAESIIKEQDSEKFLEFLSEKTVNLETLEELTLEALRPPHAKGQVILHPAAEQIIAIRDITTPLKQLVDKQEKLGEISTALANRFRSGRACVINYGCVGLLTIGTMISLICTHFPITFLDMFDCEINQCNKCVVEINTTSKAGCLNFFNWSEGLWACCNNYSNTYCHNWKHNYTQASPRANLRVWMPVMVSGSAFLLFQLIAFFITRSKSWTAVNPQTKSIIERYDTKIKELQFEEV